MTDRPETCETCGFDSTEWDDRDSLRTIGSTGPLFHQWTEGMSDDALNRRPGPGVWSPLEYSDHTRETLFAHRVLCEVAIESPDADLGPAIEAGAAGTPRTLDADEVFAALAEEATTFADRLAGLDDDQWGHAVCIGGERRSIRWASRHAVHDLWQHLIDIAEGRVAVDDATPADHGDVEQINASGGGVPKVSVEIAAIGRRGLAGDRQEARLQHGRPWQALCLWSADVIEALQTEGHLISAGSAGENLTLRGLDWNRLRAGSILEIGDVRCQLSAAAIPCAKNAQWFVNGDFNRILHTRHPGWSRWYASVMHPGEIRPGDEVHVVA